MNQFKIGDSVNLKSGGPRMTVTRIGSTTGTPFITCMWFANDEDKANTQNFHPDALEQWEEIDL